MDTWITDVDGDILNINAIAYITVSDVWDFMENADGEREKVLIGHRLTAFLNRPTSEGGSYGGEATQIHLSTPSPSLVHARAQLRLLKEKLTEFEYRIIPRIGSHP